LKLEKFDEEVIRRIYMDVWEERHVGGGPETWMIVIMKYLESKGYEIRKKDDITTV
jgi:hypothetical protein